MGYALSDRLEVVGGSLVNHVTVDGESGTNLGFNGGLQVNFATSGRLVPFVRGGIGILTYSDGGSTSLLAPILAGGFRILVHDAASVNVGVEYQHETNGLGNEDTSGNTFGLQVGVSIFPGSIVPTVDE